MGSVDHRTVAVAPSDTANVHIELQECTRLVFEPSHPIAVGQLIALAWASSAMLEGRPVRCIGLLPGLTLQLHTRLALAEAMRYMEHALPKVLEQLEDWVDQASSAPLLRLALPGTHAVVTTADITQLFPPAVVIERQYGW